MHELSATWYLFWQWRRSNVPQTGAYADEGADELRAFQLAVEHLNGGGDGGCLNTFSSKALKGNGIMGS